MIALPTATSLHRMRTFPMLSLLTFSSHSLSSVHLSFFSHAELLGPRLSVIGVDQTNLHGKETHDGQMRGCAKKRLRPKLHAPRHAPLETPLQDVARCCKQTKKRVTSKQPAMPRESQGMAGCTQDRWFKMIAHNFPQCHKIGTEMDMTSSVL